jgi:2-polyprenyl-6-methoxyphenol hydroxylase-like FAD-dependent oxidoreductase
MSGIVLKRLGHKVHILEADPSSIRSSEAAGIRAGPAMQEFLENHDHTGLPWAVDCPGMQFIDRQNKVVRLVEFPMKMTGWSTLYYRLRANFDAFETPYVPKAPKGVAADGEVVYDYGKRVVGMDVVRESVGVRYENVMDDDELRKPKTASADLVIAADGSGSSIREQLCSVKRPYAGYVAWRGSVVENEVSEETRKIIGNRFTIFKMKRNYILV